MIELLTYIGLAVLLLFILIGIPLIVWLIAKITDNDSEKALFSIFITINTILVIVISLITVIFIYNPEQLGYQKIQTEQTMEVNESGKN